MAQLAEQLICNQQVIGSSPIVGFIMAQWLSWLERRPVTAEVEGSSPFWVVGSKEPINLIHKLWDLSSAGRASALQAEGHRFEPCRSHSCRRGGTGRRTGLKILRDLYSRTGSIPVAGIEK